MMRQCGCGCGREVGLKKDGTPRAYLQGHSPKQRAQASAKLKTGHARRGGLSPTYNSWRGMIYRCMNPNSDRFRYYGELGVTVCRRWQGSDGFAHFLADMGERPERKTLDRIDPYGNYEPDNCRWATQVEQVANRRANPRDVKLRIADVVALRLARSTTSLSYSQLGEMFGLEPAYVGQLVRNDVWRRAWPRFV